jgi:hypothetical protein
MLSKVENAGHDFVRGQEVVGVEGVIDEALLGLAGGGVAGYTTQHDETQVVTVNDG